MKSYSIKTLRRYFFKLNVYDCSSISISTITSVVPDMVDMKRMGKIIGTMLLIFVIIGIIASVIMSGKVKVFHPAQNVSIEMPIAEEVEEVSAGDHVVEALTVTEFLLLICKKIYFL